MLKVTEAWSFCNDSERTPLVSRHVWAPRSTAVRSATLPSNAKAHTLSTHCFSLLVKQSSESFGTDAVLHKEEIQSQFWGCGSRSGHKCIVCVRGALGKYVEFCLLVFCFLLFLYLHLARSVHYLLLVRTERRWYGKDAGSSRLFNSWPAVLDRARYSRSD